MSQRILRLYGVVFALCGALFVFAAPLVVWGLNLAVAVLPGSRPIAEPGPTLWLGLTGSMMAMIAYISLELAWDPAQETAWNVLLLSKFCSTCLFAVFALRERNSLFLVGSLTDGSIFLHLLFLRRGVDRGPLARRAPGGRAYEVWFAKLNDPKTRAAFWLRYTLTRTPGGVDASCWWVFFDPKDGGVRSGRWSEDAPAWPAPGLEPGRACSARNGTAWDIRWSAPEAPAFGFIPPALALSGAAASGYVTPVSLARFSGTVRLDGREHRFEEAPGCVGHIWGSRMAHDWRWAHAVFEGKPGEPPAVFEILSARVRLGPWLSPRLTCANLWRGGRLHRSVGLWRGFKNVSERAGDEWTFAVDMGGLEVAGRCAPAAGLTASLDYDSPDGRRLVCRNSKTGSMELTVTPRGGAPEKLAVSDAAAVEFAEGAA